MATIFIERKEWVVAPEEERKDPYLLVFNKQGEVLLFEDGKEHLDILHGQKDIEDAGFPVPESVSGAIPYLCDSDDASRLRLMGGVFLHPDLIFHSAYSRLTTEDFREKLENYMTSGAPIRA
jgi:hypothetical protein